MSSAPWDLALGRANRRLSADRLDSWLASLVDLGPGFALGAVGGLGRREPGPGSDLDLVLVHEPGQVGDRADRIWYPIWDAGYRLDHSVRTPAQARRMAAADIKVFLGLLDLRHIAGDAEIIDKLRSSILADWRGLAARRIPELRAAAAERSRRFGSVAHLLEPDLKESAGGLRDITVLRAIAAASLTDIPHAAVEQARGVLLDVRDGIAVFGTGGNRLLAQDRDAVAVGLGMPDSDALLRVVATSGRSVEVASDQVWHRVGRLVDQPRWRPVRRRGERSPLADGVVVQDNEVVLALDADPSQDPTLVLRAAAAAAQTGRRLGPHAVERLRKESAPLARPWPSNALTAFVSLLGAGTGLLPVWEELDQSGAITALLPEWERVRSLPQHSPVHRFALDRHLIEATIAASASARTVQRPDLLLLGTWLHDIGKGFDGDHCEVGVGIADAMLIAMGVNELDRCVLARLIRHHLLLPDTATRRDLEDPKTVEQVCAAVGDHDTLDLLHALTIADAAATGPAAWSSWKAGLITELVARAHGALSGKPSPKRPVLPVETTGTGVAVHLAPGADGWDLVVVADDRVGLLAAVAGVLARHRLAVRSATTETVGTRAATSWQIAPLFGEPPELVRLRADLIGAVGGSSRPPTPPQPPRRRDDLAPARVIAVPDASARATVLEVRAHDEAGLLHRIAASLASAEVDVVAARISTFGAEAVDVFYVVGPDNGPLTPERAAQVCQRLTGELA